MHCGDIRLAGFSCDLKTLGLATIIIVAAMMSATAAADNADPWTSQGPEGRISDFSGVIAGWFDFDSDPGAHVTLDGTDLSWSGEFHFQTFDLDEIYAVDPELWRFYPFSQLNVWSAALSVQDGGELTAVNIYTSRDKIVSVDGSGSVLNVLSKIKSDSDMSTVAVSNGGVINCDSFEARHGGGKIEVDGDGSTLNVHATLDMYGNQTELSISNGGTVTCDSIAGGFITITGANSLLKISSYYRKGGYYSNNAQLPGIRVHDGGRFLSSSNLHLPQSTVLNVSDGGYAQIGGNPAMSILPGTVRVANGGELNSFGQITGHLLIEEGGSIYQRYTPDRSGGIIDVYYPIASFIDVSSAEINPGGRLVMQAGQSSLEFPSDQTFDPNGIVIVGPNMNTAPWLRVQDHADLHGTIEVKLTGDTLPQPEQMLRLVESLGTMDISGLTIESAPWLQCTPVVTDEGLSASFQFVGDGSGGQHIGPGSHLSGVIATEIDDVSVVTAGIGRISWSNGCHLVAEPAEHPGTLFVGYRGDATLSITGRTIENRSAYVGTHTQGSGKVFLEGPDAKWIFSPSDPQTDDSLWKEQSELVISDRDGYGEVAVGGGASLEIADGRINIGGSGRHTDYTNSQAGSSGIIVSLVPHGTNGLLLSSGPGSTVTAANIDFGGYGHRELRIEDGGKVTCGALNVYHPIHSLSNDVAKISVDGVGSVLECEASFAGLGSYNISIEIYNGGRVSTKNAFHGTSRRYPGISRFQTAISKALQQLLSSPISVLPGDTPSLETTVIDGNGSVWDNAEEYRLHYGATLTARNSGQMNTRSLSVFDGNLQLETSARVFVAEKLTARRGSIDLHGGGTMRVGINTTGDIPDGTIVVGNGGEFVGDAMINGDMIVESGGIITCRRNSDYFLVPDEAIHVDSFDLQAGGALRIEEGRSGPFHGELVVEGDACLSGVVEVGTFSESVIIVWPEFYVREQYFPRQPVIFDLITVGGICDWSDATLNVPENEMNRYVMHEHGLRVLKTPPPGDANGDGLVNDDDASILVANWHSDDATWKMGDFDLDGDVDGDDMLIMSGNWGHTSAYLHPWDDAYDYPELDMSRVPEPSVVLLVLSGIAAIALAQQLRRGAFRDDR